MKEDFTYDCFTEIKGQEMASSLGACTKRYNAEPWTHAQRERQSAPEGRAQTTALVRGVGVAVWGEGGATLPPICPHSHTFNV